MTTQSSGLTIALALALAACGSTAPSASDVVGTWHATRVQYVSTTGLGTVDLIASGGTATLTLSADSTYEFRVTPTGGAEVVSSGTWSMSIDVMTVRETGVMGEMQFDMVVTASTLTLGGASAEFDFNGDGTDDPATVNLAFTR